MEQIIAQLIDNFDFALILILNVITYIVIKILDEINKEKNVTTWQKRLIFVISAVIVGTIYYFASDIKLIKIINSIIITPVAWSWLAKPIAHRMGIDYRKIYK